MKFIDADTGLPVTIEQLHERYKTTNIFDHTQTVWPFFALALIESGLTWPAFEEATFNLFWTEQSSWIEIFDNERLWLITNWLKNRVVGVTDGTTVHVVLT